MQRGLLSGPDRPFPGEAPGAAFLISRLPWIAFGVSMALTALGLWLLYLSYETPVGPRWGPRGYETPIAVTFSSVGALIASRRPRNSIGWLCVSIGFLLGVENFVEQYAVYAVLTMPGVLPGGELAAWISAWIWAPWAISSLTLLPLLFPTGRLVSPRWRLAAWLAIVVMGLLAVSTGLRPGPLQNFVFLQNPVGIPALSALRGMSVTEVLPLSLFVIPVIGLSWSSLVVRYHKSAGNERAQLRWFLYAVSLAVLVAPMGLIAATGIWGPLLVIAATHGIPISMGVAILRHRLYTIDLIVNRTLVYGALTGVLAAVYLAAVAILQAAFRAIAGQDSALAIVVSTLAIAALFSPFRRRIQAAVDRRFYRSKYDAAHMLAEFASTARDEMDAEQLMGSLLATVDDSLRPAHVSLWLPPQGTSRPS